MTDSDAPFESRSARQAFAIGPTLYLRPIELADAQTATIWRPRPYPVPIEVVEEQLKKALEIDPDDEEGNQTLLICRKVDDQPVGSVRIRHELSQYAMIFPYVGPLTPESEQDEIIAEVIGFLTPWLLAERGLMSVIVEGVSGRPALERVIHELDGRLTSRHRERFTIGGQRRDRLHYQVFHPAWVDVFGEPPEPVMGEVDRVVSSPATPSISLSHDERPDHAFAAGERVYLRPFKPDEGALVARWTLEEPEIYYNEGRFILNPVSYGHFHKKLAEPEIPSWIRFAIVLRETNELIGANGLDNLDWVSKTAETETEIFQPQYRSAGLGTEAKHLLLEYGFERLGLHMIYSFVDERNIRSQTALRKQGYRDAGSLAWLSLAAGHMLGVNSFDLLASEWRAARDQQGASLGA